MEVSLGHFSNFDKFTLPERRQMCQASDLSSVCDPNIDRVVLINQAKFHLHPFHLCHSSFSSLMLLAREKGGTEAKEQEREMPSYM